VSPGVPAQYRVRNGPAGHGRGRPHIFRAATAASLGTVDRVGRELLIAVRPPKPVSRMTDEELDAWAAAVVEAMRQRRPPEPS
jgi:hypothetical protein